MFFFVDILFVWKKFGKHSLGRQFVDILGVNLLAWFSFDSDLFLNLILRFIFSGNIPLYIPIYPTKG